MEELKQGHDGAYHKKHLTAEEKAVLWHLARFAAIKVGLAIAIGRFAKNYRAMEEKRRVVSLLNHIDETAEKLKEMRS